MKTAKTHGVAKFPEVSDFLRSRDITVDDDAVLAFGRNPTWRGRTDNGDDVFVKFENNIGRADRASSGTHAFFEMLHTIDTTEFITVIAPTDISADGRVQVYPWCESVSAAQRLADGELGSDVLVEVAREIVRLHNLDPRPRSNDIANAEPMPGGHGIPAIPIELMPKLSGAQLGVWSLIHRDTELLTCARERIFRTPPDSATTLVHGDLRLDQVLVDTSPDGRYLGLVDWESFGYGDPARDVGTLLGNVLSTGVAAGLMHAKKTTGNPEWETEIEDALEVVAPMMRTFLTAYRDAGGCDSDDFTERAIIYAGWHQFDRLLANAEESATVNPLTKAIAGVGRACILEPREVLSELELSGAIGH